MGPEAVLFSEMVPEATWEDEFNRWYDEEHVPARLAMPGFIRASRYLSTSAGRNYLAVYELAGEDVLATPAYRLLKTSPSERTAWMLANVGGFTRYTGPLRGAASRPDAPRMWQAPYLYAVRFTVPPERQPEFEAWYDVDHVPTLLREPAWQGCRCFRLRTAEPERHTHLALHYLSDPGALQSPFRDLARRSPWRDRLASEGWFRGSYQVFRRLPPVWEETP